MSSASDIFLMHLMSGCSSEISIVQDNANTSSFRSLARTLSGCSALSGSSIVIVPRRRSRSRDSSRWEPVEAVHDDLPYYPMRQDSNRALLIPAGDGSTTSSKDSRPKKPLRQQSSKDLALPRIPRRQPSFRKNSFTKHRSTRSASPHLHDVLQRRTVRLKRHIKGSSSFSEPTRHVCGAALTA